MGHFHDPASGLPCRVSPQLPRLFSPSLDVGNVVMGFDRLQRRCAGITGIGAQVFVAPYGRGGPFDLNGIEYGFQLADIMTIGPGYDERQRDATAVHQQMSLASFFFPDPSDWGRSLLAPTALSSWSHRCSASATQSLPFHRIPRALRATTPRTRLPSAIPGSAYG